MKSPFILSLIFSVIIATIIYFAIPPEALAANMAAAIGILAGGILIPLVINVVTSVPTEVFSPSSSTTTLYVGNLPYRANEEAVSTHFSEQGNVVSVRLMKDRRTGKRKGYGFVEVESKNAESIIQNLNDSEFQERTLKVRLAKDKTENA